MEQEQQLEQPDPLFVKGFNNGYFLAKHDPQLAAHLTTQSNEQNSYFKGFMRGKQEYDREVREWAKSFSKGAQVKEDRGHEKER